MDAPQQPRWPVVAAWVLASLVAALLVVAGVRNDALAEARALQLGAALFALFGVGFLLAARYPRSSIVYRYLTWTAERATRWYHVSDLSGLVTGGKAGPAGWLCLALALLLALASLWL